MNHKFIRTISISALIAVTVFIFLGASSALAASTVINYGDYSLEYSLNGDEATVTGICDYDMYYIDVDIPSTISYGGKSYKVTAIGKNAFEYNNYICHVSCPSVEMIGEYAFDISSLESIECPNVKEVGNYAFSNTYLTEIDLPKAQTIGAGAFCDCIYLESLSCPDVSSLNYNATFWFCENLTSIDISKSNPKYYTDSCAFYERSDYDGDSLIFFMNKTATSYTTPANVTLICDGAVYRRPALRKFSAPDVEFIGGVFEDCANLESVSCPNVSAITRGAFAMCPKLTEIVIAPDNPNFCIMSNALIHTPNKEYYSMYSEPVLYRYLGTDKIYTVPSNVKIICNESFSGCLYPEEISCANTVQICSGAFEKSNVRKASGKAVTEIGSYAFENCSMLESVDFPNAKIVEFQAFMGCKKLKNVSFPNAEKIGQSSFYNCSALSSVSCPNVHEFGQDVFRECPLLTEIVISANNPEFYSDKEGLYSKDKTALIYYLDKSAENLIIPEYVKYVGDGRSTVFDNCNLRSIVFPDSVDVRSMLINNCDNLKQISVNNATVFPLAVISYDYYILGWNTKEDGSGTFYDITDEFNIGKRMNLYMMAEIWDPAGPTEEELERIETMINSFIDGTKLDSSYDYDKNGIIDGRDLVKYQQDVYIDVEDE